MEESEEKSRGFKVEDKRRFSSEGDLRPEFQESTQPADAPAGAAKTPEVPEPLAATPGTDSMRAPQGVDSAAEPSITFATFLVGLSTQALVHLGEIPDPGDGQIQRDLDAARQIIDLIGVVRDKTRGNLDKDEQAMTDAILFDLRMKYVELAKSPGA